MAAGATKLEIVFQAGPPSCTHVLTKQACSLQVRYEGASQVLWMPWMSLAGHTSSPGSAFAFQNAPQTAVRSGQP